MPFMWFRAYVEMLEPLKAEEQLSARTLGLVVEGHLSKRDNAKIVDEWIKRTGANGSSKNTSEQALANAAAMGLGVKRVV